MSDLSREQFEAAVIERMKESGQVPWIGGEAVIEAETFAESDIRLICGDCLETMRTLPDNSVDSVVTDPPYGLSFMGKKWDYDVPSTEIWAECLRVLKPGGHLLAFAGTRTQHRMAVRIEDAGFEIRDMIAWVYGSGMPKSFNMDREKGKTICGCDDEEAGSNTGAARGEGKRMGREDDSATECELRLMRGANVSPAEPSGQECGQVLQSSMQESGAPTDAREQLSIAEAGSCKSCLEGRCNRIQKEGELREHSLCSSASLGAANGPEGWLHNDASTDHSGMVRLSADANGSGSPCGSRCAEQRPAEPGAMARQSQPQAMGAWPVCGGCGLPRVVDGLGTALKPALEPITVARKPFKATVAANVLAFGTGAININACRVAPTGESRERIGEASQESRYAEQGSTNFSATPGIRGGDPAGRWPANLVHDGSPEVVALFPNSDSPWIGNNNSGAKGGRMFGGGQQSVSEKPEYRDTGSAARFFYCAKTSRKDRNEGLTDPGPQFKHGTTLRKVESAETQGNNHPTVKPTDLMRYLCRLVTPAGGLVLDPFMGSGSTGKAASLEGFRFVGIELDPDYFAIAKARVRPIERQQDAQRDLFSDESR